MLQEKFEKQDKGKINYALVPIEAYEAVARIMTFGAEKYRPDAWKYQTQAEDRYFSALMRHLVAYRKGEKCDPESGMSHLEHALTNLTFLLYFEQERRNHE